MKIAIVHDWLTGMRGGEKCLEVLCKLFPDAHLYTLIHKKNSLSPAIENMDIRVSFLQSFPGVEKYYRYLLPVMPRAIEQFNLNDYDLVLSSSHCVAKGVKTSKKTTHICYCFTPMRYIWDQSHHYFNKDTSKSTTRLAFAMFKKYLQRWDVASAERVDHFVAISEHVSRRIKKYYKRESDVIYPPVDTNFFEIADKTDDYYLIVSAFAPYKKIDLAIEAFNKLGYPLKIIGNGQCEKQLRQMAGSNIEFLGSLTDEKLKHYYSRCKAFIFPGEEDFGITPLEAQASGRPVIAFGKGGALETVVSSNVGSDTGTGIFFHEQTAESLIKAVQEFEKIAGKFNSQKIREHSLQFDRSVFEKKIFNYIESKTS